MIKIYFFLNNIKYDLKNNIDLKVDMNNYCINCSKIGHNFKKCNEPIISCGIICFKIDNLPLSKIEKFLFNKYINIEDFNYNNINYYNKINFHRKDIKFLMIQRKKSLSYIEFIRGKYNELNINKINEMFKLMSKNEVYNIKKNNFEYLWEELWNSTSNSKTFMKEMNISHKKFNYLKKNNIINNFESEYLDPEWGFPKGRRMKFENNNDCANREFIEETNLLNYTQFERINLMEEVFIGTNNIPYKHIYYIAGSIENNLIINNNNNYEVGNIGWFTIDEVLNLIRPYNLSKINIINQIYFFLATITDKIKYKKNKVLNVKSLLSQNSVNLV